MDPLQPLEGTGLTPVPWAGDFARVFPVPERGDGLRERYRGCLLGGAVGDALGRPVEGWPAAAVRDAYPRGLRDFRPSPGWSGGPRGTVTDDTQLTIEIAEWLVDARSGALRGDDVAARIERWGHVGRGIGMATHQALANLTAGVPWWRAGTPSAGNGAAMRAAPYGLRFAGQPDALRHAAALGTVPTHADVTAVASAVVQAVAVTHCLASTTGAVDPATLLESVVAAVDGFDLPAWPHRNPADRSRRTLTQRIEEVADLLEADAGTVVEHFYNGAFVLETTPIVLWCLLARGADPEEALVTAVMAGGDADTVAAMVGNLVGALHGVAALPVRWTGEDLEHAPRLAALADRLYELRWPG